MNQLLLSVSGRVLLSCVAHAVCACAATSSAAFVHTCGCVPGACPWLKQGLRLAEVRSGSVACCTPSSPCSEFAGCILAFDSEGACSLPAEPRVFSGVMCADCRWSSAASEPLSCAIAPFSTAHQMGTVLDNASCAQPVACLSSCTVDYSLKEAALLTSP